MSSKIIYITMVGFQPAVVAVAVKTLTENGLKPAEIILLHTGGAGTTGQAERLEDFFCNRKRQTWWQGSVTRMEYTHHDISGIADRLLELLRGKRSSVTVYYDCSPSTNYHQALMASKIGRLDNLKVVYAEYNTLLQVGGTDAWQLADLGLDTVLSFHGLGSEKRNDGDIIVKRGDQELFPLQSLYERQGRIFAEALKQVENKGQARQFVADLADKDFWNGLHVRVLFRTSQMSVYWRLRADQIDVVYQNDNDRPDRIPSRTKRIIKAWERKNPPEPGRYYTGSKEEGSRPPNEPIDGAGGHGAPLLVCLGNDPSSTLLSLYSHKPKATIIYYDQSVNYINGLASRVANHANEIPAGRLIFRPISLVGAGIDQQSVQNLLNTQEQIHANISPGSKAQAWVLARLQPPVVPCSLHNQSGTIRRLDNNTAMGPYSVPDALLQAEVCGGALEDRGRMIDTDRYSFLKKVAVGAAGVAAEDPSGKFSPGKNGPWTVNNLKMTCEHLSSQKVYKFTVEENGTLLTGFFKNHDQPEDGFWLEEVTAAALIAAGMEDVRVGVRWKWLEENSDGFRTEIDVIGRWGTQFVAVSVKSGLLQAEPDQLEKARMEIIAEASARMGRYCHPVLVRPIKKNVRNQHQLRQVQPKKGRLLEIGVYQLGRFDDLKEIISTFIGKRHTT